MRAGPRCGGLEVSTQKEIDVVKVLVETPGDESLGECLEMAAVRVDRLAGFECNRSTDNHTPQRILSQWGGLNQLTRPTRRIPILCRCVRRCSDPRRPEAARRTFCRYMGRSAPKGERG